MADPATYPQSDPDQAAMQPETFVNPMVKALMEGSVANAAKPGQLMAPNPYPPGSEEHSWYEDQRAQGNTDWANRNAVGMLGGGAPMAKPGTAGIFGGKLAQTANLDKLEQAQRMIGKGQEGNMVRQLTGWHQGPDGEWRFEIPDERSKMLYPNSHGPAGTLFQHQPLYKAYPQLQNIDMYSEINPKFPSNTGRWDLGTGIMEMSSQNNAQARLGALHEMQHAVQHIEGFTPGTTEQAYVEALKAAPKAIREKAGSADPFDLYWRTAGEVEPRNVEARSNFGPQDRYQNAPHQTQDIPYHKQLVIPPIEGDFPILQALRGKK